MKHDHVSHIALGDVFKYTNSRASDRNQTSFIRQRRNLPTRTTSRASRRGNLQYITQCTLHLFLRVICANLLRATVLQTFLDFKAKGKNSDLVYIEMYCLKIYFVSPPFWVFFLLLTIRANIFSIRGTIRYTIVIEDDFLCSLQWPSCSGIINDWPCQLKSLSDGTFKAWWHQTPSVI